MRRRSARVEFTIDPTATGLVHIRIWREGDHTRGELELFERGARSLSRQVSASTCGEVSAALALAAVLVLDPEAVAVGEATDPAAPANLARPAPDGDAPKRNALSPELATPDAELSEPLPARATASVPEVSPAATRYRLTFGVEAFAVTGVLPHPAFAPGVFVQLNQAMTASTSTSSSAAAPVAEERWRVAFTPAARLSIHGTFGHADAPVPGAAEFLWIAVPLHLCPLSITMGAIGVSACAFGELGLLQGKGGGSVPNARTEGRPWYGAGASAFAQWWASDHWLIGIRAGARIPLAQETFRLNPGTLVHEPGPGIELGVHVGVRN